MSSLPWSDFFCESYLSKTKVVKILRMQIALIRRSFLAVCLYSVLHQSFEKPRLDHKVDTRKLTNTHMIDDCGSRMACLSRTNVECHNVCINTPKHSFLFTSFTDTNADYFN